jgi:hypothetical protein
MDSAHGCSTGRIPWWWECSLEYDEGIVNLFGHAAGVKIEIPATGSHFAGGNCPQGMAIREQPSPGAARTTKSLNESERAEDWNHPALLNLHQRHSRGHLRFENEAKGRL